MVILLHISDLNEIFQVREIVQRAPLNRLLLETDSPFLPLKGKLIMWEREVSRYSVLKLNKNYIGLSYPGTPSATLATSFRWRPMWPK